MSKASASALKSAAEHCETESRRLTRILMNGQVVDSNASFNIQGEVEKLRTASVVLREQVAKLEEPPAVDTAASA